MALIIHNVARPFQKNLPKAWIPKLRPKINKLQKIAQNIVRQQIKAIKDVAQGFEKSPKWQMLPHLDILFVTVAMKLKLIKRF